MEITRIASINPNGHPSLAAGELVPNYGVSRIYGPRNMEWDSAKRIVTAVLRNQPHEDGKTRHDYTVALSLRDISAIVEFVGSLEICELTREFDRQVPSLVKLLACATGVIGSEAIDHDSPKTSGT